VWFEIEVEDNEVPITLFSGLGSVEGGINLLQFIGFELK